MVGKTIVLKSLDDRDDTAFTATGVEALTMKKSYKKRLTNIQKAEYAQICVHY